MANPDEEEMREVHRPLSPMGGQGPVNGTAEGDDGWLEVGKKNKVIATRTTKSRESVITRIFGGKLRSILKQPGGAGKTSATLEPYQPLQLDIQVRAVLFLLFEFSITDSDPAGRLIASSQLTTHCGISPFLRPSPSSLRRD